MWVKVPLEGETRRAGWRKSEKRYCAARGRAGLIWVVLAGSLYGRRGIIVEGELVRLRAYEPSDIGAVMKWVNDPEVTQHLEAFVAPVSRLAEERWLETAALGADPNHRIFAIETLGGEYLGGIDLRNIAWRDRKAELGIAIGNKN